MVLHCVTGLGHEPEVAPTLPVFSLPMISDHLRAIASLDTTQHSPPVSEYSSSEESTDNALVSSDSSGKCVHVWHSTYPSAFPVPITSTYVCLTSCTVDYTRFVL